MSQIFVYLYKFLKLMITSKFQRFCLKDQIAFAKGHSPSQELEEGPPQRAVPVSSDKKCYYFLAHINPPLSCLLSPNS